MLLFFLTTPTSAIFPHYTTHKRFFSHWASVHVRRQCSIRQRLVRECRLTWYSMRHEKYNSEVADTSFNRSRHLSDSEVSWSVTTGSPHSARRDCLVRWLSADLSSTGTQTSVGRATRTSQFLVVCYFPRQSWVFLVAVAPSEGVFSYDQVTVKWTTTTSGRDRAKNNSSCSYLYEDRVYFTYLQWHNTSLTVSLRTLVIRLAANKRSVPLPAMLWGQQPELQLFPAHTCVLCRNIGGGAHM